MNDFWRTIRDAKWAGMRQGVKGGFEDFGMRLGRIGWKGNPKNLSGIARRGNIRMGMLGGGAVAGAGGGAYLHHRSSARNGLQARSSGGY